jgi:hypothetical protein
MNLRDLLITLVCGTHLYDWITVRIRMMNYKSYYPGPGPVIFGKDKKVEGEENKIG